MRVLILGLLVSFAALTASALGESAPNQCSSIVSKPELLRGGGDAWPWGEEMPFPWKGIKGVWMAEIDGCPTYFTFSPLKMESGINQLRVKQYDPTTCKLISRGVGYEQDRYVKAVLLGKKGAFDITVHVFKNADGKTSPHQGYNEGKTATVLSLGNFTEGQEPKSYQLYKMNTDPASICTSSGPKH